MLPMIDRRRGSSALLLRAEKQLRSAATCWEAAALCGYVLGSSCALRLRAGERLRSAAACWEAAPLCGCVLGSGCALRLRAGKQLRSAAACWGAAPLCGCVLRSNCALRLRSWEAAALCGCVLGSGCALHHIPIFRGSQVGLRLLQSHLPPHAGAPKLPATPPSSGPACRDAGTRSGLFDPPPK